MLKEKKSLCLFVLYVAVVANLLFLFHSTITSCYNTIWNRRNGQISSRQDPTSSPAEAEASGISGRIKESNIFVIALCKDYTGGSLPFNVTKLDLSVVVIKTVTALTSQPLKLIVLSDSKDLFVDLELRLRQIFREQDWKKLTLVYQKLVYPQGREYMRNVFKPCSTARLFVPSLLNYDSAIYLDSDTIFLRPPEQLWQRFGQFKDAEVVGATQTRGFYNRNVKTFPFYGDTGLNAGVLMMNLTRLDAFPGGWLDSLMEAYDKYKQYFTSGDQDILNVVFSRNRDLVHEIGCEWNYSGVLCTHNRLPCWRARKFGVALIHGNSNSIFKTYTKVVFFSWKNYAMGSSLEELWKTMERGFDAIDPMTCPYTKDIRRFLTKWAVDNWKFNISDIKLLK